jgi:hypothetical protein
VKLPKDKISNVQGAFKKTGKDLAKRVHKTYDELVSDWKDDGQREIDVRPEFHEKVTLTTGKMIVSVKTDSEKYRYVDLGTEPHTIEPRPDNPTGMLVFPSGYTARTRVRSLQTRGGGKHGPLTVTPIVPEHPGNEAREFEVPINKEQTPLVIDDLKKNLSKQIQIETESYGF